MKRTILLTLILLAITPMAKPCADRAREFLPQEPFSRLGYRLNELPEDLAQFMRLYPEEILAPQLPGYRFVRDVDATELKIYLEERAGAFQTAIYSKGYLPIFRTIVDLKHPKSLDAALTLLERAPINGDYYFIGNGMYPLYLLAHALLEGTAMSQRVHLLSLSSELPTINREHLHRYLKRIGLDGRRTRPVVLIDSVSNARENPNDHSLLRLAIELRWRMAADRGQSYGEVATDVVVVGISEGGDFGLRGREHYQAADLDEFYRWWGGLGDQDPNHFNQPYIDSTLLWAGMDILAGGIHNTPRWLKPSEAHLAPPRGRQLDPNIRQGAKYVQVDDQDLPIPYQRSYDDFFACRDIMCLGGIVRDKLAFIYSYQELIRWAREQLAVDPELQRRVSALESNIK